MKATQGTTYRMLNTRLNDLTTRLEDLREIGSTGKKLNKPSDDPTSIRPVLSTRKQLSNVDRYLENMGISYDKMQATDGSLEHIENLMQHAKELTINAVNGVMSPDDLAIIADEIHLMRDELLGIANTKLDDRFAFAGYQEDTRPFIENPAYDPALYNAGDHTTWPVLYQGDGNATMLEVAPDERLKVNLTGSDLFLGVSSWDPAATNAVDGGRYDLFTVLAQAEDAIRNNDQAALQTSLADLDGAANQNRRLRADLGGRTSRMETAMAQQEDMRLDLKQILSRYEDADAIEAFNNIIQQETAFQAALSITGRVSQLSILDYI